MSATTALNFEYVPRILKSGKRGRSFVLAGAWAYCPVAECERCGRRGSPSWIRRWWMTPWTRFKGELAPEEMDGELCIGCAAKERRHWKAFFILRENRNLIRKIQKEIARVNASHCG